MKKTFLFLTIVCFLGLLPYQLAAQNEKSSQNVHVDVNARVIESINITTIRDMRFGNVQPGQDVVNISPVNDPDAGKMVAKGFPEARIRISFQREWQLTNDRGGEPLTFFYRIAGNTTDDQNTAELLQTNNRDLHFNADGEFYFWIGGRVNISNASPGNYEGEFTIEIEYI